MYTVLGKSNVRKLQRPLSYLHWEHLLALISFHHPSILPSPPLSVTSIHPCISTCHHHPSLHLDLSPPSILASPFLCFLHPSQHPSTYMFWETIPVKRPFVASKGHDIHEFFVTCPPLPFHSYLSAFTFPLLPVRLYLSTLTFPLLPVRLYLSTPTFPLLPFHSLPIHLYLSTLAYPPLPIHLYLSTSPHSVHYPSMHLHLSASSIPRSTPPHICFGKLFRSSGLSLLPKGTASMNSSFPAVVCYWEHTQPTNTE